MPYARFPIAVAINDPDSMARNERRSIPPVQLSPCCFVTVPPSEKLCSRLSRELHSPECGLLPSGEVYHPIIARTCIADNVAPEEVPASRHACCRDYRLVQCPGSIPAARYSWPEYFRG